jgi:type II secretory pathway pseudopilin PulG
MEIMIVVVIIGMLAAMALPGIGQAKRKTQNARFINDLRIAVAAYQSYNTERGGWPPDGIAEMGPEIGPYLDISKYTGQTLIGGNWDWDNDQFGFKAGLSLEYPSVGMDQMLAIDRMIDDGNGTTGIFRQRDRGWIYILEF